MEKAVCFSYTLKYFLEATAQDAPQYHVRAKQLLERIAIYLKSSKWLYMDSRITRDVDAYLEVAKSEHSKDLFDSAFGTLAFQYPFSRVFLEYLGNSYSGPDTFNDAVSFIIQLEAASVDFLVPASGLIYGMAACVGEVVDLFTGGEDFVFGCGRYINTHSEVYELLIQNAYPISKYKEHKKNYFNHRMLLHTAWLVLDSDVVEGTRKKTFAKRLVRYVYDMWGRGARSFQGPARENLLFATVAKRSFQLLNDAEIIDAMDVPWYLLILVRTFKDEVDRVINKYINDAQQSWQPNLPLGEPVWDTQNPGSWMPWMTSWEVPSGIGRDHAWGYKDMNFRITTRTSGWGPLDAFSRLGPYYTDLEMTLSMLKRYARVGYKPDDPAYELLHAHGSGLFFKIEAGGLDFMFERMLLTHMGVQSAPSVPDKNTEYSTLPWSGASPWISMPYVEEELPDKCGECTPGQRKKCFEGREWYWVYCTNNCQWPPC